MLYHKKNLLGACLKVANVITRVTVGVDLGDCLAEVGKGVVKASNEVTAFSKDVGIPELASFTKDEAKNGVKEAVKLVKTEIKEGIQSLITKSPEVK